MTKASVILHLLLLACLSGLSFAQVRRLGKVSLSRRRRVALGLGCVPGLPGLIPCALAFALQTVTDAQAVAPVYMPLPVVPLNFATDALEPVIDNQTMVNGNGGWVATLQGLDLRDLAQC